jgi:hypothetical protein
MVTRTQRLLNSAEVADSFSHAQCTTMVVVAAAAV